MTMVVDGVNAAGKDLTRANFLAAMESGYVFQDIYNSPLGTFSPASAWPTVYQLRQVTNGHWGCRSATSRTEGNPFHDKGPGVPRAFSFTLRKPPFRRA